MSRKCGPREPETDDGTIAWRLLDPRARLHRAEPASYLVVVNGAAGQRTAERVIGGVYWSSGTNVWWCWAYGTESMDSGARRTEAEARIAVEAYARQEIAGEVERALLREAP